MKNVEFSRLGFWRRFMIRLLAEKTCRDNGVIYWFYKGVCYNERER